MTDEEPTPPFEHDLAADFSPRSTRRAATRARLLALHPANLPPTRRLSLMNRFAPLARTLGSVAMLLLIVLSLSWLLSNTAQLGAAPDPTATPLPPANLDRTDFDSVLLWVTYAMVHNQPEMLGDLIEAEGVSFLRKWHTEAKPPGYDNSAIIIDALGRAINGANVICIGFDPTFADSPPRGLVIFDGLNFNWNDVGFDDGGTTEMLAFTLMLWEGEWQLHFISNFDDSYYQDVGELSPCIETLPQIASVPETSPTSPAPLSESTPVSLTNFRIEGDLIFADECFTVQDFSEWEYWQVWDYQLTVDGEYLPANFVAPSSLGVSSIVDGVRTYCDTLTLDLGPGEKSFNEFSEFILIVGSVRPYVPEAQGCYPYLTYLQAELTARNSGIEVECGVESWGWYLNITGWPEDMSHEEAAEYINAGEPFAIHGEWSFTFDLSQAIPLTLASTSEEIRLRILDSPLNWQTVWVDAIIEDFNGIAPSSQRVQLWANQPAQARVLSGPVDGAPAFLWISDGEQTRTGEEVRLDPDYAPPRIETNSVYPHPMTGILPTRLSELLFPSGLAQRGGTYVPTALETIAGREALVVEWSRPDGPLTDRFWVDTLTGVILRQQNYGKGGDGALTQDITVTTIQFDYTPHPETFNRLAPFPPAFAASAQDIFIQTAAPAPAGEPDTSPIFGEIYMMLETNSGYENAGLIHFPASCLITGRPCPQPNFVPGLPEGFGYPGLSWSPDGARLVYPVSASEEEVWLFDRPTQTWTLFDAPYFSGIAWSPDGIWLAGQGITYGDPQSTGIILVTADPIGQEWFTVMEELPGFKSLVGWLDNHRILLMNALDSEMSDEDPYVYTEIQIYDMQNGEVTVLAGHQWDANFYGISAPLLSPDRSRIAYSVFDETGNNGIVINLETGERSVFPILPGSGISGWSPDGTHLVLTASLGYTCEIHLIPVDGSDDRLLFTGDRGSACDYVWSPDGQTLLIAALAQNPTVPRLYVINVATGETRLVELPDVGIPFEWPRVSWLP